MKPRPLALLATSLGLLALCASLLASPATAKPDLEFLDSLTIVGDPSQPTVIDAQARTDAKKDMGGLDAAENRKREDAGGRKL